MITAGPLEPKDRRIAATVFFYFCNAIVVAATTGGHAEVTLRA
jgi:hypothetical protein